MNTISISEAYIQLSNIKLPSAYNSISHERLNEDENKIDAKIDLILKIKAAEKTSGITEIRDLIEANNILLDYYNTANSNIYYKENISKSDREYVKSQFSVAKSEEQYLNAMLDKKLNSIRIEI